MYWQNQLLFRVGMFITSAVCILWSTGVFIVWTTYVKNEVTNNINFIITRITDQNSRTELEVYIEEHDEPEELTKQSRLKSQAANELRMALETFMKI